MALWPKAGENKSKWIKNYCDCAKAMQNAKYGLKIPFTNIFPESTNSELYYNNTFKILRKIQFVWVETQLYNVVCCNIAVWWN